MDLFHIAARIASVPIEAYRHKSGKFDLSKFKGLDPSEMFEYAKSSLEEIGRGSSRAAFVLSSGKVLKIAVHQVGGDDEGLPHAGMAQNEKEVEVYTNPKAKPVVAKIFEFDPNFTWLISELVRPIHHEEEWEELTESNLEDTVNLAGEAVENGLHTVDEKWIESIHEKWDQWDKEEEEADRGFVPEEHKIVTPAMVNLVIGILGLDLNLSDLKNPEQWGKTSSGRIVLLDYGLSDDIYNEYY